MKKIIVKSTGLDQQSIGTINAMITGYKGKNEGFTVEIKPIRDLRSLQQNKLWWVFCEAVSRKIGEHKEWCADLIKKEYMKSKGITEWIETSRLDINEMNSILDFAFFYLMEVVEGYLDVEEGNEYLMYQKNYGGQNGK